MRLRRKRLRANKTRAAGLRRQPHWISKIHGAMGWLVGASCSPGASCCDGSERASFRGGAFCGGLMDSVADALIGAAAANMAAESFIDVRVGGRGIFREERGGGHDHADLAIATLRDLVREPCLLHGMLSVGRKSFDGGDVAPGDGGNARGAGARGFAVHVDSAGAAQRLAAAEFCPSES